MRAVTIIALVIGFAPAAQAEAALTKAVFVTGMPGEANSLRPSVLEASDAVIRNIDIRNGDVFDTTNPIEDRAFYRLVNVLHIETREDVIRRQLLIRSGEPYRAADVAEAARMLRANHFLQSAEIVPVVLQDGAVDLAVVTEDTWSLTPSISFSHKGGLNTGGVEIEESNLLGTGSEIKIGYKSTIERDETFFAYNDPQLGASRLQLGLSLADASDGSAYRLALQQPFYALDARRAYGMSLERFDQVDPLYQSGEVYDEIGHSARRAEVFYGWSDGLVGRHVSRVSVGLGYDFATFTPLDGSFGPGDAPQDRRDVYPFFAYERLQNRYETTRNADNIERVEDRYTGTRVAGKLGYASAALGSDEEAWLYALEAQRGFKPFTVDTVLLFASVGGRRAAGGADSYRLDAAARYYHRQTPRRLFYAEARMSAGERLDTDEQITTGGDTGLRGYPARFQSGNRQVLLTLEQRFYTDWYPFRLFRVGAAAFFDAGRAWDPAAATGSASGWLRDVGVGLRIGSPRSSTGRMLHIDIAYPLDGPDDIRKAQLVVETSKSF